MVDYIADNYEAIAARMRDLNEQREAATHIRKIQDSIDLVKTLSGEELDNFGLNWGARRRGRSDAEYRDYIANIMTQQIELYLEVEKKEDNDC